MSSREKRLLVLFSIAGVLVLNFVGFNLYQTRRESALSDLQKAERELQVAEMISMSRDQVEEEFNWLADHEPEPAANQDVQTQLQRFCENQAEAVGLTIRLQRPMPSDTTPGNHFHRAKFQFTLTGEEKDLYRWYDRVNMPSELRIATEIRLNPNKEDDAKIDCTAIVEQWFVPIPPSV